MADWTQDTLNAYLAGLVDGEGCVSFGSNGCGTRVLRLTIFNTNLKVLLFVQKHFGGTIHKRGPKAGRLGNKACYQLVWQAKTAEYPLACVKDYLIIKKRQVELAGNIREIQNIQGYNKWVDRSWMKECGEYMSLLNS